MAHLSTRNRCVFRGRYQGKLRDGFMPRKRVSKIILISLGELGHNNLDEDLDVRLKKQENARWHGRSQGASAAQPRKVRFPC